MFGRNLWTQVIMNVKSIRNNFNLTYYALPKSSLQLITKHVLRYEMWLCLFFIDRYGRNI